MNRNPILSSTLTATIWLFLILFVVLMPEYHSITQVGLERNSPVFASTWGDYRCALPRPACALPRPAGFVLLTILWCPGLTSFSLKKKKRENFCIRNRFTWTSRYAVATFPCISPFSPHKDFTFSYANTCFCLFHMSCFCIMWRAHGFTCTVIHRKW